MKTESLCPVCLKTIPARKIRKGADVFLEKTCGEHGEFSQKIAKDAKRFLDKTFSVEGKPFTPVTAYRGECGRDCGWCEKHRQHICSGLVEITEHCNLACPICYFGKKKKAHLSVEECENRIDTLLKVERGKLDVLQLSGGECLLHPQFGKVLDAALAREIGRIAVNTNGRALLKDEGVFWEIKKHRDRVEVYLQFDGFDDEVYKTLRGKRLLKEKLAIVQKLNEAEIKICLAVTVYAGNLKEIPAILDFAVKTRHISGITFQRLTKVGNACSSDVVSVFQEDILAAIADSGMARYKDLIPLPCSHENCTSLGFLFCTGKKVHSLGEYVDFSKCKDALANRVAFDQNVMAYMRKNLCDCFIGKWLGAAGALSMAKLQKFVGGERSTMRDMKVIRIIVKNFMDADTFDFERARKCCTGVSAGDGKVVPFCIHNALKGALHE